MNKIILNRAKCGRCDDEVISTPAEESCMCRCGYLAIDGGRDSRIRFCMDLPGDERYRDFQDTSILTSTWSRRGLTVEAFRAEASLAVLGPDGVAGTAEPGDWVVLEPEGGTTSWSEKLFHIRHESVE